MIKFLILFFSVLLLDQGSKLAAARLLSPMRLFLPFPHGGKTLFQTSWGIDAALVHSTNRGAAWSLLANHEQFLLGVRMTIVAGILFWLIFLNKKGAHIVSLGLIVGGAISNILDTLIHGHVIDIFYFRFWGYDYPIFNVADMAICLGAFLLAISFFKGKKA